MAEDFSLGYDQDEFPLVEINDEDVRASLEQTLLDNLDLSHENILASTTPEEANEIAENWYQKQIIAMEEDESLNSIRNSIPERVEATLSASRDAMKRLGASKDIGRFRDVAGTALGALVGSTAEIVDLLPGVEGVGEAVGESVQNFVGRSFSEEQRRQTEGANALDIIAGGAGQAGSFFLGGGVFKVLGTATKIAKLGKAATAGTVLVGLAQTHNAANMAYQDVLSQTGSEDKARGEYVRQWMINGGLSIPQTYIATSFMRQFQSASKKALLGSEVYKNINRSITQKAGKAFLVGAGEAVQETGESLFSEASKLNTIKGYDYYGTLTDKEVLSNALKEGLGGFGGGTVAGTAVVIGGDRAHNIRANKLRKSIVVNALSNFNDITIDGEVPRIQPTENTLGTLNEAVSQVDEMINQETSDGAREVLIKVRQDLLDQKNDAVNQFAQRAKTEGREDVFKEHLQKQGITLPSNVDNFLKQKDFELLSEFNRVQGKRDSLSEESEMLETDLLNQASQLSTESDLITESLESAKQEPTLEGKKKIATEGFISNLASGYRFEEGARPISLKAQFVESGKRERTQIEVGAGNEFEWKGVPSNGGIEKFSITDSRADQLQYFLKDENMGEKMLTQEMVDVLEEAGEDFDISGGDYDAFKAEVEAGREAPPVRTTPGKGLDFTASSTAEGSQLIASNDFTKRFLDTFDRVRLTKDNLASLTSGTTFPIRINGFNIRDIDSIKNARTKADVKVELDRLKLDSKNINSEIKRLEGSIKENRIKTEKEQKALDVKAQRIKKVAEGYQKLQGKVDVVKAGNSRLVSVGLEKKATDYVGALLAGFDIQRPVVLADIETATNKALQRLLLQEGVRLGKPLNKQGKMVPTARTISQGGENDVIITNEKDLTERNTETLAHEIGHVVIEDLMARNTGLREKLVTAWKQDTAKKDLVQRGKEQKLPQRQIEDAQTAESKGLPPTTSNQVTFTEWTADQVGRFIQNKALEPKGAIEKFFYNIAQSLRNIYSKFVENSKLRVNPTIEQFLDGVFSEGRMEAYLQNRAKEVTSADINANQERTVNQNDINEDVVIDEDVNEDTAEDINEDVNEDTAEDTTEDINDEDAINEELSFQKDNLESLLTESVRNNPDIMEFLNQKGQEKKAEKILSKEDAEVEAILKSEGLAEETIDADQGFIDELAEVIKPKGEKRAVNKLFMSIMEKGNYSKEFNKYFEKNGSKSHKVQAMEGVVENAGNYITANGILASEKIFLDRTIGMPADFRVALGAQLQQAYDNLAISLNKRGMNQSAGIIRRKQFVLVEELNNHISVDNGRGVNMLKIAINTNSVPGIQRVLLKYHNSIAKNNGEPDAKLSQQTIDKINGLAEEVLSAKRVGNKAVMERVQHDMHTAIMEDVSVKLSDILSNQWYMNKLSGLSTTVGMSTLSNFASHLGMMSSALATSKSFRTTYSSALRSGVSSGIKNAYNTFAGIHAKGDLSKYDISKSQEDVILGMKRRVQTLIHKENKTKGELVELKALQAYTPLASAQNFVSFKALQAGDELFFATNREIFVRGLVANEILKGDPNLTSAEVQAKVVNALTDGKAIEQSREDAKKSVNEALSKERLETIKPKEYEVLVQNTIFENTKKNVAERFGDDLLAEAEFFAEKSVFKNEVEGVLSLFASGINSLSQKSNRLLRDTDKGKQMLGIGLKAVHLAMFPFNKTVFNAANLLAEFSPLGLGKLLLTRNGSKMVGMSKGAIQFKNVSEFERQQLRTNAIIGSLMMVGIGVPLLVDWDDDSYVKLYGSFKPYSAQRKTLQEAGIGEYSISIGDTNISFKDTIFRGLLGPIADISSMLRFSASNGISPITGESKRLGDFSREEKRLYVKENVAQLIGIAAMSSAFSLVDSSPLGGLAIIDAFSNPNEAGIRNLKQLMLNNVSGFNPLNSRILNDLGSFIGDPKLDKTSVLSAIYSNTPFASRALGKEEVGLFGESIIRKDFFTDRIFRDKTDNENYKFLVKNDIYPSAYDRTIKIQKFSSDKTEIDKVINQRRQDAKIKSFKAGFLTEDESYDFHKNYTGPLFEKIIAGVRKKAGAKPPEVLRDEINGAFSKARELMQRKYLDDKYKTSLFSDYKKQQLKKLIGE